jgi:hypothetical protein
MGLKDIKDTARGKLHEAMHRPALYLVTNPAYVTPVVDPSIPPYIGGVLVPGSDPAEYTYPTKKIREHYSFTELGDMKGTNFSFAERQETKPRLIFLNSEFATPPERNAIVVFDEDTAYRIDNRLPVDGITTTCECLRLSASELAGLPVPDV